MGGESILIDIHDFTRWQWFVFVYAIAILLSIFRVCSVWRGSVELADGGPSFDKCVHFDVEQRDRLKQNYDRIQGTLKFWKREAKKYEVAHVHCVVWTILFSSLIPLLTHVAFSVQGDAWAQYFLSLMTLHASMVTSFHRFFKVEKNFKAFRIGESEFYDLYRRMLDRPHTFGLSPDEQIEKYLELVAEIRKSVRNAETDTYAGLDDIMPSFSGAGAQRRDTLGGDSQVSVKK